MPVPHYLSSQALVCSRGYQALFTDVSFTVNAGSWLHVQGENGAGKTSLLRLLCGLTPAESGQVCWDGQPIAKLGQAYRNQLSYLGHQLGIKDELTVLENLRLNSMLAGKQLGDDEALQVLDGFGLGGREFLPVRVLSQGQRRRLALSRLALSDTPLWLLDEPFVALDSRAVTMLQQVLAGHLQRGGLLVFTSHQEVAMDDHPGQILRLAA